MFESMSSMLEELFQQRKQSFINSLERSISVICSDQFLNQHFKDKRSNTYIPDRICDLIQQCLHDDREDYISQIFSKLRAIESCFGLRLSVEIEEIGQKLLSIPASSPENEIKRKICLDKLKSQIKKINNEFFPNQKNTQNILRPKIISLKNSLKTLSNSLEYFQSEMHQNFLFAKNQINSKYISSLLIAKNARQSSQISQLDILKQENMTLKALIQVQNTSKNQEREKEEEIEQLKRSLRESKSKIDDLMYENQNSKANLNRTKEKFEKIKKFAKLNDDNNNNYSEFQRDSSFDETDILDFIKKLKRDNQFAQTEIAKLRSQNEKLTDENIEFRSQSSVLSTSVSQQNKNMEDQNNFAKKLEIENNQLKNVNNQLLTASKNLQQQNKEALDQVAILKRENTSLKRKINLLVKRIQTMETEKNDLQNQVSNLSNLNDMSKTDTENFKEETAREIQKLKTQNQDLSFENAKLNSQLDTFKENSTMNQNELSKKTELNSQLSNENIQLNSQIQIIQSKLNSVESNKDALEEKIKIIQGKYSQLENENKILQNENKELQNLHQKTMTNCAELKDATATLTELNSKLTIQNKDLQSLNEASKNENKMFSTYKDQLEKLQNEFSESMAIISKLKQENAYLNTTQMESRNLKEKIDKINAENNELQNISQQMKKEIRSLESTIDEKERKISDLTFEKTKIESRLKESEDKLFSVQNVNGLIGSKGDQLVSLMSQNESLKQSLQSTEINLTHANEDNSKLVKALQKSKLKIRSLKQDLIKVFSVNDELINKNQSLVEIKKRVTKLSNSKFSSSKIIDDDSSEVDNVQRISDTIHDLKRENKDQSKTINKIELFQKKVFNIVGANSEKEAERIIEGIIKQNKEDSILLSRIREILNINQTESILTSFRNKLQKLDNYINKERQLRKALKINSTSNYDLDEDESETLKAILLLKVKAENNENLSTRQTELNNSILKRLCTILQTSDVSKLAISIQAIQEQINDARVVFKQLREALDISNDDEIVDTVQSIILKLKERDEKIEKIRASLKCSDYNQLPQKAFDAKNQADIMNKIKSFIKVDRDEDIPQYIQKLLSFQNRVKSTVQINNNNNSEINPLSVFENNYILDDEHLKLKQIQENESIVSQLCLILKNDNKNEFPLIVQNMKNYIEQACQLLHVSSYNQLIPSMNKIVSENSQINGLQNKISEKSQKVTQMKKMMQSLESQVTEISSFSNERKMQNEVSHEEISNLQSSLKASSRKMKSLLSKIDKKNDIISSLKQSLVSLRKENESILNQKSFIDSSFNETQSQIKKIENDLNIDSINKIPDLVNDLKSQLASFSEDPFKNKAEMNRINTFRSCLKEISALLISTDINDFAKEIEELKEQNEELNKMKNHLSFALSLRINESLTGRIDEIVKQQNEAQAIFGKLCLILDVPNKEDVSPAVDSIIRENKELKNQARIIQSAVAANSQQALLKSIKTMKQNVSNFIERYNLADESELSIIDNIMKKCEVCSMNELQEKVDSLIKESSILSDLYHLKGNLERILNTKEEEGILKKAAYLVQFQNNVKQGLNSNGSKDMEVMIQRLGQFEEHEEEICKILNISNPVQINEEITSLIQIAKNQKQLMKFFNAENDSELIDTVSRMTQRNEGFLGETTDADLRHQIEQFIKKEKKICKLLCLSDSSLIYSRVSALKSINDKLVEMFGTTEIIPASQALFDTLNNICSTLNYEKVTTMLNNSSSQSQQSVSQSQIGQETEFKFIGVDRAVEKLNNDFSMAVSLFSQIFAILSGQEKASFKIIVKFPITPDFEQKIISTLIEMKQRSEQCQILISKANLIGYKGKNCVEAVDVLISNLKNQEKSNLSNETKKISSKMQSEIIKEKKNAELEQQELKKSIDDLQEKIAEMKKNEESLNRKLKREKKKNEMMNMNLLKEKEVNQSLVTILHGNSPYSTDTQINRSIQ